MGLLEWLRQAYQSKKTKYNTEAALHGIIYGGHIWKNPLTERSVKAIIRKIEGRVYEMESDLDRVKLVTTSFSDVTFRKFLETMDATMTKHECLASGFKRKSYKYTEMAEYEMALRCCNLAFMFLPSGSDLLPSLHADRAMFLYTLNDSDSAMKEVDRSLNLENQFSENLRAELIELKGKCQRFVGTKESITIDMDTKKRKIYCDKILFKVHGDPHLKVQSAGNYVSIVVHPVKGRMLVVTQDLPAGTTVIVEDPFVTVMTESTNWELKHCSKCYKKTSTLVPCPGCIHTAYCSEECRLADYDSIHKYECPCMNYLHAIYVTWSTHLGFRAVAKTGPESMFNFFKESKADCKHEINGVDPETGRYDSDYLQIYNLMSHPCLEYLELHSWHAVSLVKLLDMKTSFFENVDVESKPAFMLFVASSMIKHFVSFQCNSMNLWEDKKLDKPERFKRLFTFKSSNPTTNNREQYNPVGMNGVFTLGSLICHACVPSAHRTNLMNGRLAIITSRRLKAGEEITISYGYGFSSNDLEHRTSVLGTNFYFKCDCVACACNWPTEDKIGPELEHLCSDCSDNLTYEEMILSRKCVLTINESNDSGKCGNCEQVFDINFLNEMIEKNEEILEKGHQLIAEDNPVDAIPPLIECIEYFQKHVMPPYVPLIRAQSSLSSAYEAIAMNTRV